MRVLDRLQVHSNELPAEIFASLVAVIGRFGQMRNNLKQIVLSCPCLVLTTSCPLLILRFGLAGRPQSLEPFS
jgi:hypothetical protein